MLEEVEAGVQCILNQLTKLKKKERERFQRELVELLLKKYEHHWYQENPKKGSAFRCIEGGNNPIDKIIEQAAQKANIHVQRVILPKYLFIWIDPFEVSYSTRPDLQYQTKVFTFKHKMNPNAKTFQPLNAVNSSSSPNRNTGNMISRLSESDNTNNVHRSNACVPTNSIYRKRRSNPVNTVTNTIPVKSEPVVIPSSSTDFLNAITNIIVDETNMKTNNETSNIFVDDDILLTNGTHSSLVDTIAVPDRTEILPSDATDTLSSPISIVTTTSRKDVLPFPTMLSKTSIGKDEILSNLDYLLSMFIGSTDRVNTQRDKDAICAKATYEDNESMLTQFLNNKIYSNIYSLFDSILLARIVRKTRYGEYEAMVVSFVIKRKHNRRSITQSRK